MGGKDVCGGEDGLKVMISDTVVAVPLVGGNSDEWRAETPSMTAFPKAMLTNEKKGIMFHSLKTDVAMIFCVEVCRFDKRFLIFLWTRGLFFYLYTLRTV